MNESQTGEASNPFLGKVLVGVDGSDGSHDAVEWTARLATATGAEVLAVHILTYDRELLRDLSLDTIRTWRRDLAHELETGWTGPLRVAGVAHRCVVLEADSPAAGLLAVADREQVDLLVVGALGRGRLVGRILGGVSYRLLHHADRPVVVVPRGPEDSSPI
jgi:nucleotide-binding universal stress UspA family protein